jgi:positive regulator of sigma E activity
MYGLPVLGLLAGAAFGNSLAIFFHMDRLYFILGGVVLWLLVAINYARIFKRDAMRQGKQPVIVEIEVQKMVIDMGDNPGK